MAAMRDEDEDFDVSPSPQRDVSNPFDSSVKPDTDIEVHDVNEEKPISLI